MPTTKLDHWHDVRDWYRAFLDAGMRADVVPLAYEWEQYDLLVLPTIFMLSDGAVHRIEHYVDNGGSIVVGYATGIVNDSFQVGLGGYPGAGNGLLRRMLGVSGEEFNIDNGGSIVVGYATGIVNDSFQVGLGGYPGAGNGLLRRMLGVSGEEFNILGVPGADDVVELTDGGVSNLWQTCLTRCG